MSAIDIKNWKTVKDFKEIGDIVMDDMKRYEEWLQTKPRLHNCSLCKKKIDYWCEWRQRGNKLDLYFCTDCCTNKARIVGTMVKDKIKENNE